MNLEEIKVHEQRSFSSSRGNAICFFSIECQGRHGYTEDPDFDDVVFEVLDTKRKGDEVVKANISVARLGYQYAKQNFNDFHHKTKPISKKRKMLLSGNEAISLGAVKGGMKFYAAYPMTPASNILHYLIKNERNFNEVKVGKNTIELSCVALGCLGFNDERAGLDHLGEGLQPFA